MQQVLYNKVMAHTAEFKRLEERYGMEDASFLRKKLEAAIDEADDPCVDNYRVCDLLNEEEVAEYEVLRAGGCCGYHDEVVTAPSGREYWIGFNYGH